jgi:hypothetical protein
VGHYINVSGTAKYNGIYRILSINDTTGTITVTGSKLRNEDNVQAAITAQAIQSTAAVRG